MWKRFFHNCEWLPTVLELDACHLSSVTQYNYLQQLLPHVEEAILSNAVLNAAKVNFILLQTTYSDYPRLLIVQLLIVQKVDNSDGLKLYE